MKSFLVLIVLFCSQGQASTNLSHDVLNFSAFAVSSIRSAHSDVPNMYAGDRISLSNYTVYGYAESAGSYEHTLGGYVHEVNAQEIYLESPQVSSSRVSEVGFGVLNKRKLHFLNEVRQISLRLEGLKKNSTAEVTGSTLVIRALVGKVTVVDVSTSDLNRNITIEGDAKSLVVIRISGSTLKVLGRRTNLLGLKPDQVLLYSSSVTSAQLMDSGPSHSQAVNGLLGSWILPKANVDFSRALIVGNLITANLSTSVGQGGQINPGCFKGLNSIGVGCKGPSLTPPSQPQPPCTGPSCGGDIPLH